MNTIDPQPLDSLIQVTASLIAAAREHKQLQPLADEAKKMLLAEEGALEILLNAYNQLNTAPKLPNPFTQRMAQNATQTAQQKQSQQLIETLLPLLQQAQK